MEKAGSLSRVKQLFSEVCDLPDLAARQQRLAELETDPALIERVLRMVEREQTGATTTRFSLPVAGMIASAVASGSELRPGDRLGAWTLQAELGAGGMGRVFLAERSDGHYRQRAAIKLLRGWSNAEALARLARERQILASLSHPHIARLLDGGATPMGRPYLVMEYVEGQAIDAYCRAQRLDLDATLALFAQVCDAVGHAHLQLVVHCDIKPSNVLVTPEGRAMLLDFGIAQLDGQDSVPGQSNALTPRYASPEQHAGAAATPASDIFSLGRLLDELLRAIEPPAPRGREWRAIVAKATASTPEARYLTVQALIDDLGRFRRHRPLNAVPRSAGYALAKLLRRRWPWALAGAAGLMMAVIFTLRVVHERDRAIEAEQVARSEAERAQRAERQAEADKQRAVKAEAEAVAAEADAVAQRDAARSAEQRALASQQQAKQEASANREVSDFVVGLFKDADPRETGRPDLPASVIVDKGRERIDAELRGQPALQASLKGVLGRVYENIGKPQTAAELYAQAAVMENANPLKEAQLRSRLAVVLGNENQNREAEVEARRALSLLQGRVPVDSLELAEAHNNLGMVLSNARRFDESRVHLQRSLEIKQARLGNDHADVASTLHNLGQLHRLAGDLAQAEDHYRRAMTIKLRRLGERNPSTLESMNGLAVTLAWQGQYEAAEALQRRLLELRRSVHGNDTIHVERTLNELASVLQDRGRPAEAIQRYQEALVILARVSTPRSMAQALLTNNLATAHEDAGDLVAAEAGYRESLAIRRERVGAEDLAALRLEHNLGRLLMRQGQLALAAPLLTHAAQGRIARLPAQHGEVMLTRLVLAELALRQGALDGARDELNRIASNQARLMPVQRAELWRQQGLLARAEGRTADAISAFEQAWTPGVDGRPPDHPARQRVTLDLAEALAAQGATARARGLVDGVWPALAAQPVSSALRQRGEALHQALATTPP
ncbi:MAG: tetratricopeptide repeat protein [Burkholderiales bacterium]|nr:tetratricopeptide repeat protein [Burkholderiales bacterium]